MPHISEWDVCDDGSEDVSAVLNQIMASLKAEPLQLRPGGIYRLDFPITGPVTGGDPPCR